MASIIVVIVVYRSTEIVLEVGDSITCRRELTLLSSDMCQVPSRHHVEVRVFASPHSRSACQVEASFFYSMELETDDHHHRHMMV